MLNASKAVGQTVIQYTCNNGANERWTHLPFNVGGQVTLPITVKGRWLTTDKFFDIKNVNSGLCLTVANDQNVDGQTWLQYPCDWCGIQTWGQYDMS